MLPSPEQPFREINHERGVAYCELGSPASRSGQAYTLRIHSYGADMAYLDYISVSAVPEPSTVVHAAVGLFGLLAYAWRRRR